MQREPHKTDILKRLQPSLVDKNIVLVNKNWKKEPHNPKTIILASACVKCFYHKFYKKVIIPQLKISNKSTLASSLVLGYSFGIPCLRLLQERIENQLYKNI